MWDHLVLASPQIPSRTYRMQLLFFFQAEDGIRDWSVTGVQTCALPISGDRAQPARAGHGDEAERPSQHEAEHDGQHRDLDRVDGALDEERDALDDQPEVGRASCRERV